MLHYLLIPLLLLVSSQSAQAAPCELDIDLIGPSEITSNDTASYLIRIENRSDCDLRDLVLVNRLPKDTRMRRANPEPTFVERRPRPHGPEVTWTGLDLPPEEVALFEFGAHVKAAPGSEINNQVCIKRSLRSAELCENFIIRVTH